MKFGLFWYVLLLDFHAKKLKQNVPSPMLLGICDIVEQFLPWSNWTFFLFGKSCHQLWTVNNIKVHASIFKVVHGQIYGYSKEMRAASLLFFVVKSIISNFMKSYYFLTKCTDFEKLIASISISTSNKVSTFLIHISL